MSFSHKGETMRGVMLLVLGFLAGAIASGQEADRKERKPADAKAVPEAARIDVVGAGETAMELATKTRDPDAKWMAIRILGNLGYQRAVPLLLKSLSDSHPYVRANAARALGDMRVAAAAKPLTRLLEKEENGGVIEQTSLAMMRLHHTEALPALKAATKHENVQTRMWVLQAIGELGSKKEVAFLARFLLKDPSDMVQMAAAQAIEHITGTDFGFPKRSGPSSPEEGIKRAREWWDKHKGEYSEDESSSAPREGQGIKAEVRGTLRFEMGHGYYILVKGGKKTERETRVWLLIVEDKILVRKLEGLTGKEVIARGILEQTSKEGEYYKPPFSLIMGGGDVRAARTEP